jgi:hypothetical protein
MSKPSTLTRAVALAAMVAAMSLAGATAAQAHATDQATRHPRGEPVASQRRQSTAERPLRILLARERFAMPDVSGEAPAQVVFVATRPAEPGGQAGWLIPALTALSAVLALVAGVAVTAARRAIRGQRAGQTA